MKRVSSIILYNETIQVVKLYAFQRLLPRYFSIIGVYDFRAKSSDMTKPTCLFRIAPHPLTRDAFLTLLNEECFEDIPDCIKVEPVDNAFFVYFESAHFNKFIYSIHLLTPEIILFGGQLSLYQAL